MLCIIFTGTKMVAGIHGENLSLIHFGEEGKLSYQGKLINGFQTHFPSIVNAYHSHHHQLGQKAFVPIPLILVLPTAVDKAEKEELIQWIRTKAANTQIVLTDSIDNQYIQFLKNTGRLVSTHHHLVAEATGKSLRLSIVKSTNDENAFSVNLPQLGWESGKENLLEYLFIQLSKKGWFIQPEDEAILRQALEETSPGKTIELQRETDELTLNAEIKLDLSTWNRQMAHRHELLQTYLNPTFFETHNISKLILIGNYFDNNIILNYICDSLNIKEYLYSTNIQHETKVFNNILINAFAQADTIHTTLIEVQQSIQHPSKDVVPPPKSNDQLYAVTNDQLVTEKDVVNISSVSARPIEPIVVDQSPHPINYQTERSISATVLEAYFDVDELYSWNDHLFFRGALKASGQDGVIRFVANGAHSAQDRLQHFRKLHEFESSYYPAVGLVQSLKIGHFYRRNFLEGEPLDRYIKNSGIYKKRKINQLNTNDLKLVLQIWKAINGLNFACKNMQEGNILVQSKLKWNLSKSIDIQIVGFNTRFCSKAEMIEEIHQIFERQFGRELYSQIRSKFNI